MNALTALTDRPWAIRPEALQTMAEIAMAHAALPRDEWEQRVQAVEVQRGEPLGRDHDGVSVRDGVATIAIDGPIFRKANLFVRMSGATSIDLLAQDIHAALEAPAIHAIILAIDSPGGEVNGTAELADLIYAARATKPIVAYVSDLGASAAYWIASAASEVVLASTASVGSIGVIAGVPDPKKDRSGVIEFISSQSPDKRPDPHTGRGRSQIQAHVDALADLFVAAVARNRGASPDTVLSDFGQGGLFVGQAAVDAGLADRVGSYEEVLAQVAGSADPVARASPVRRPIRFPAAASARSTAAQQKERQPMPSLRDRLLGVLAEAPDDQTEETLPPMQFNALQPARYVAGESVVTTGSVTVADPRIAELERSAAADREKAARLEAQAEEQRRLIAQIQTERLHDQATAYVEAQVLATRVLPAEAPLLTARYIQDAMDDAERPASALGEGMSRVAHLKAEIDARRPHGLTGEALRDDVEANAVAVLYARERAEENGERTLTPERRKKLLNADTTGRALLDDEEKAERARRG